MRFQEVGDNHSGGKEPRTRETKETRGGSTLENSLSPSSVLCLLTQS